MTRPPTHTYNVDLTNPGQFLACCGLLELATCLDHDALGWFGDSEFHMCAEANNASRLVELFGACDVAKTVSNQPSEDELSSDGVKSFEKSPALHIERPFGLALDWWLDQSAIQSGFRTWGGPQKPQDILEAMRRHITVNGLDGPQLLMTAVRIGEPKPFYFDSRLSVLTTLSMGFSADGMDTAYSPAVEALALVGLQRFRPETVKSREEYAFSTWAEPLPASIASAVMHGLIEPLTSNRFQFPFVVRTGGKYKAFGPALPKRSNAHG